MNTSIKYAAIFGTILSIYGFFYRATAIQDIPGAIWLFYVLIPVCTVFAWRELQSAGHRILPGISWSFLATLGAAAIYGFYVFAYNTFVDDSLMVEVKQNAIASLQAAGASAEEIATRMQSPVFKPAGFGAQVALVMSVLGLVTSLVLAAASALMSRFQASA